MCPIFWRYEEYLRGSKSGINQNPAGNKQNNFHTAKGKECEHFFKDHTEAYIRYTVDALQLNH